MEKEKNKKRRWHDLKKKQKVIVISLILITLTVTILMSIRVYLFLNFLAGNDILIKLNVDKPNVNLLNGQEQKIIFDASVTANPSCRAKCSYSFVDVTNNATINQSNFEINSGTPIKKEFTLLAPDQGRGQILYLFTMECQGIKTYTCDTSESVTDRNILVSLNYDLNEQNVNLTNDLKIKLNQLVTDVSEINFNLVILNQSILRNDFQLNQIYPNLNDAISTLRQAKLYWDLQRYNSIYVPNITTLEEKYKAILSFIEGQKKKEILQNEFSIFVGYDTLCQLSNVCYSHDTIQQLASNDKLNITTSCDKIQDLAARYTLMEIQNRPNYLAQNYNITPEFTLEITNRLTNLKNQVSKPYLENLPNDSVNYDLLTQIIKINDSLQTGGYDQYNLTPAIIAELVKIKPNCTNNYNSLVLNSTQRLDILFENPNLKCGFYTNYSDCCSDSACRNDPTKYPIIFLHGHDFNKDISADYSLDAFQDIEKNLTENGYLTAGIISVSSEQGDYGRLGLTNVPLTIRGSYYYDVFKTQQDYQILQQKSENIDTYAVRLNDIINNVKFTTGRPKVIIIAHSMGGLVARRYAQIFGNESIDKMILIGTPNHGIEGTIMKACPIFGEKLECEDMDSASLFMNKLNSQPPNVKIYNIMGVNCTTDGQPSDGIAFEKNAYLDGAENINITGTCNGVNLLHNEMLNVEKYPKVMKEISYALNLTN